ncbi:MAG: imidazolonepropionase [Deltaproteobacteria bacterium]|nr:imidazolonepropionase [Deltaproteobacteria bacterium]
MTRLIGPFAQALTLRGLAARGPLRDEALEVIPEAGVAVGGGRVVAVGPWAALAARAAAAGWAVERVEEQPALAGAGPLVLTPGLVDAHTHLCFAGDRARDYAHRLSGLTYQEIAARGGGIQDTARATRAASDDELAALNAARLRAHLARGVTTVEVKSGYGLSVAHELRQLRVIRELGRRAPQRLVSTCLAAHVPPPEAASPRDYLDECLRDLLPRARAEGLSGRVDAFIEPKAFPVDLARPYLAAARVMGFELTLHADQFEAGGARLAAELGARSADHLEASTRADLEALSAAGVVAVALPGASLGLGCGYAPARLALDVGCALAVASDWNPGSAPMGDLLLQASVLGAAQRLSGAEVWAALTTRAAAALGLEGVGALDEGWAADLAAYPARDYREVLYYQGALRPAAVWCAGARAL